jgi:hypothetical protein
MSSVGLTGVGIIVIAVDIPTYQIITAPVAIVIYSVQISRVHYPSRSVEFQRPAVAICILPFVLPDILREVGMIPFRAGINYGNDDHGVAELLWKPNLLGEDLRQCWSCERGSLGVIGVTTWMGSAYWFPGSPKNFHNFTED